MTSAPIKRLARTSGAIVGLIELCGSACSESAATGLPPITQETQNG